MNLLSPMPGLLRFIVPLRHIQRCSPDGAQRNPGNRLPNTLSKDDDPVDVMVVTTYPLIPGSVARWACSTGVSR